MTQQCDCGTQRRGACYSTLEGHSNNVKTIAFSPDGEQLITNKGHIALPLPLSNTPSYQNQVFSTIFVEDQWMGFSEQRLVWFPYEYRPTCIAIYGDTVCIGHASGQVTFLKFYLENIPSYRKLSRSQS